MTDEEVVRIEARLQRAIWTDDRGVQVVNYSQVQAALRAETD